MILGITGGIATGKSSVSDLFRQKGVPVVSADELARQAVLPGTGALRKIVERFGPEILHSNGTLDRERLAQIIFTDAAARNDLNRITHPAIARLAESSLAVLVKSTEPLIVYEAPLLFEAGAEARVDKVLVVTASPALQKQRLMLRDGITADVALERIAAQMPLSEKVQRADYLIDNSGTLAQTASQVDALYRELTTPVKR